MQTLRSGILKYGNNLHFAGISMHFESIFCYWNLFVKQEFFFIKTHFLALVLMEEQIRNYV